MSAVAERREWDAHWRGLAPKASLFSLAALATRRYIFQPAVAFYAERFLRHDGVFAEMGCGTAESSALIPRRSRKLIGFDFSHVALEAARHSATMDSLVQADIFSIPCQSASLDGIWNLGVMEHFPEQSIRSCLREFHRVLKPGGIVLLFWPTENNSSRWVLGPVERIASRFLNRKYVFFPDEVSRLRSKQQAAEYVTSEGFEILRTDFSWRTAFIHMVVVAKRV